MKMSTWPGVQKLRDLMGITRGGDDQEEFTLKFKLAKMGTAERVTQLKALRQEFQHLVEDASDAARASLRG